MSRSASLEVPGPPISATDPSPTTLSTQSRCTGWGAVNPLAVRDQPDPYGVRENEEREQREHDRERRAWAQERVERDEGQEARGDDGDERRVGDGGQRAVHDGREGLQPEGVGDGRGVDDVRENGITAGSSAAARARRPGCARAGTRGPRGSKSGATSATRKSGTR